MPELICSFVPMRGMDIFMKSNYDELSKTYDISRKANSDTISTIISTGKISKDSIVVDFGCGTGNFTCAFKDRTNCTIYGVEPSDGMREKAAKKSENITFMKGDHSLIPIESGSVDLIYMTDVIHHVPDISQMFLEFKRILKNHGKVCIVTESHVQLENRFWVRHFPSTVDVEKNRYPDITSIIDKAVHNGFDFFTVYSTECHKSHMITKEFVNLVENKGFSMFHNISDEDYEKGLSLLKWDYENNILQNYTHGETFIWVEKTEN